MRKQWSPQCTKQIAEIYDNQSIKGTQFIKEGIKALKLELRAYKKIDLNQSFDPTSFLQDLRLPLRLEIHEEEAKSRLNFRVSNNVFRKIDRIREKTGFTDSEVFEVFVCLVILRRSSIEPLVEERKEAPQIVETKRLEAPSEEKPLTIRKETINERIEKLMKHRHICYEDCFSEPFQDKSSRWMIDCPKPVFKKDRYNTWIPTGKIQGLISIEACLSKQGYWIRTETRKELQEKERAKEEEVAEEEEAPQLLIPKIPELSIDQIVNQVGVCKNPFMIREARSLACAISKKRDPAKRQACDEILEELKMSPIAYKKFSEAMRESYKKKQEDWWQAPKTEDMTLEEIEKELGF